MAEEFDSKTLYDGLVKHGLIVPVGVQGAFGRGAVFEDVLEAFNALVTKISRNDRAEVFTFPPIIERKILEKVHYLDNFPHLCGAVYSFYGKELAARQLAEDVNAGKPWGDTLEMTDVVLNPAACYPVYPSFTGTLKKGGRLVTMLNWVYRHEPSPEPTRMQSFRVREFVYASSKTPKRVLRQAVSLGIANHRLGPQLDFLERPNQVFLALRDPARQLFPRHRSFSRGGW